MRKLWNEDDIYMLNISSYYPGCNSVQNLAKNNYVDTMTPLACLFKTLFDWMGSFLCPRD